MKKQDLLKKIENYAFRFESTYDRACRKYAYEIVSLLEDEQVDNLKWERYKAFDVSLLNGASDVFEYSYGGCSLISDFEIASRILTPSAFKRKQRDGYILPPARSRNWFDVQGDAIYRACCIINIILGREY